MTTPPAFFCSWSGGKDACLALHHTLRSGQRPAALFTMLSEDGQRSRAHGLPLAILQQQAHALGIPLVARQASWEGYEAIFGAALQEFRQQGVDYAVFGDLDLEEHRQWCRRVCASAGLEACHPLWGLPHAQLIDEWLALGFEAVIVATREGVLGPHLLGRTLDAPTLADIAAAGADICGENGEFHTLVTAGPLFTHPIRWQPGGISHNAGYHFLDVLPLN